MTNRVYVYATIIKNKTHYSLRYSKRYWKIGFWETRWHDGQEYQSYSQMHNSFTQQPSGQWLEYNRPQM